MMSDGVYVTIYTQCYTWNSYVNELAADSYIITSRAFSMIAAVFSFVLFIIMLFPACCSFGDKTMLFKFMGVTAGFTSICTFLTLVSFETEDTVESFARRVSLSFLRPSLIILLRHGSTLNYCSTQTGCFERLRWHPVYANPQRRAYLVGLVLSVALRVFCGC